MTNKNDVGKSVQYFPSKGDTTAKNNSNDGPVAAVITRSWDSDVVNLTVFPDNGAPICRTSVHHKSGANPDYECWDWIPFTDQKESSSDDLAKVNSIKENSPSGSGVQTPPGSNENLEGPLDADLI